MRRVTLLALIVALFLPSMGMAAEPGTATVRASRWQVVSDWIVVAAGNAVKEAIEIFHPDDPDGTPVSGASTIIDPFGQP